MCCIVGGFRKKGDFFDLGDIVLDIIEMKNVTKDYGDFKLDDNSATQ